MGGGSNRFIGDDVLVRDEQSRADHEPGANIGLPCGRRFNVAYRPSATGTLRQKIDTLQVVGVALKRLFSANLAGAGAPFMIVPRTIGFILDFAPPLVLDQRPVPDDLRLAGVKLITKSLETFPRCIGHVAYLRLRKPVPARTSLRRFDDGTTLVQLAIRLPVLDALIHRPDGLDRKIIFASRQSSASPP
ncbi:MAG: hypothetical protein ACRC7G_06315 [Beijerinckiaceae bacterium]